jgi:signal transduction histidine kinase
VSDSPNAASSIGAHPLRRRFFELIRHSLAARLITIAGISLIGLIAMGWVAYAQFNAQMLRLLIDPEIESVANFLIGNAVADADDQLTLQALPYDQRYQQPLGGRYFQIARVSEDGRAEQVIIISQSLFDVELRVDGKNAARLMAPEGEARAHFLNTIGPEGRKLRVIARVERIPNLEGRYLFLVGVEPDTVLAPAARVAGFAFALFILFCALMMAAVSALQVRIGLEPLHELRRDIANVRKGDSERLGGSYPAELQPVASELNALIDHNREVVERARRHVGNLAHALKTPIAVLKNAMSAQNADDQVLRQSVDEMESLVERQLRRARVAARAEAQAGAQAATIGYRTPVLANLRDLIFMMEQKYDTQKAIDIFIDGESDATFRGEREDLLEMAANLIDNACKYGRSQVVVRVLPPGEGAGMMEIVVEDDGPGLAGEALARAMARGARLDEAMPGQGLGLSILKETVELYAGELLFERSDLGGLKARLRLPATD